MENETPMTTSKSELKPGVEFQNGAVRFFKPEAILTQPWIELSLPDLVHLETWPSEDNGAMKLESEVDFATSTAAILKILMTS